MKSAMLPMLLLASSIGAHAGDGAGAKALFYSGEGTTHAVARAIPHPPETAPKTPAAPAPRPATEKYTGIAYWIDLAGEDGGHVRTTARREFRSGDRIRLNFKSNRDGYLYVSNLGSTGKSRVMFPRPGQGNNFIKANLEYSVPDGAYMRFDDNPGAETLLVLLSPTPIPGLSAPSPVMDERGTRKFVAFADTNGAKDLLLEDDEGVAKSAPAQYVVAPASTLNRGKVISLYIKLRHGR